ncbi:MAG: helix-hairpin-helix domain-containing protein [Colwellia sp.]|nr:helix-hairpin-helix domain-containing protein [Colwellia sp.]
MQNVSPKKLSLKTLICALLTTTLFFTVNMAFAAPKVTTNAVVTQKYIHLNKSTIEDLVTLKGIGHKKAQAILAYRQQVGGFKAVSELIKVKGIGKKILSDNKDRLKI